MKTKKKYFRKICTILLRVLLPYLSINLMFSFYRKQYNEEFDGNTIVKINYKSDYRSKPSFIIIRNGKPLEFYNIFKDDKLFKKNVKVGDKVCKVPCTFDFIVAHKNGTSDTVFQNPPLFFTLFFMPRRRAFTSRCP